MPASAFLMRRLPSKENGLVTTATVRMPNSWATSATIEAAPVPVPPPIPAVMKTMFAPRNASAISSRASLAACWPTSGLLPAPKPVCPSWICISASLWDKACRSVLAAMNTTLPLTCLRIILLITLPPAPPTPITLISAPLSPFSIISNAICYSKFMRLYPH